MTDAKQVAENVLARARLELAGMESTISGWPADFRAIMWDAVSEVAQSKAADARRLCSKE